MSKAKPTGFVVYDGPSMIDNERILVVVLTGDSRNQKDRQKWFKRIFYVPICRRSTPANQAQTILYAGRVRIAAGDRRPDQKASRQALLLCHVRAWADERMARACERHIPAPHGPFRHGRHG